LLNIKRCRPFWTFASNIICSISQWSLATSCRVFFIATVLKTSVTASLLLYLVPSIRSVAICSALFDFSLFQLDHIISVERILHMLQYRPLVVCFLPYSYLFLFSSVLFLLRPHIFFTIFLSVILSTFIASDKQIQWNYIW
jgi:hypothetical protein